LGRSNTTKWSLHDDINDKVDASKDTNYALYMRLFWPKSASKGKKSNSSHERDKTTRSERAADKATPQSVTPPEAFCASPHGDAVGSVSGKPASGGLALA